MAFHRYRHCQLKAMPTYTRIKCGQTATAIDPHHLVKISLRVDIVIQLKVLHPFHRIDAHQQIIRLEQCK